MYKVKTTNQFEKDSVKCIKRNYDISLLQKVIVLLEESGNLPSQFKPHYLSGKYIDCRECHIKPDWLLIWRQNEAKKEIELVRTGSHSDLF